MIKLIDYYTNREKGQIMFINKSCIKGMIRDEQEGLTRVWDNGVTECACYDFKETPEEILAMPDIEEGNKNIDWEQRRYELIKDFISARIIQQEDKLNYKEFIELHDLADIVIDNLKRARQ